MARAFDPFSFWITAVEGSVMLWQAQMVMTMRIMGMAGLWPVSPMETTRMITEKQVAFTRSAMSVARGLAAGHSGDRLAAGALRPIRQRTRANVTRLSRRRPRRTR